MRKRIVAALLTVVFTMATGIMEPAGAGLPCAAVVAQDSEAIGDASITEGDFQFEEMGNGTLKLIKYKGSGAQAEIPESVNGKVVVMIGDSAFYGCDALTGITIPAGVTNIGIGMEYDVFRDCASLTEINVDSGNAWYSSVDGILCSQDKTELLVCPSGKAGSVTVADGIKIIKEGAFYSCSMLQSITIPASVTEIVGMDDLLIERRAFKDCISLTEIIVDEANAVYCSQDGMIYVKRGLEWVEESRLNKLLCCPRGKKGNIEIPDTTGEIGMYAFTDCSEITRIEIPARVSSLSVSSFQNCSNLAEIAVDEGNAEYASKEGVLYDKAMTRLMRCPAGKSGTVAIPDSVTAVDEKAFENCAGLKSISIGKGVVSLNDSLDSNRTSFNTCSSLEEITVDVSNRRFSSLDGILYDKEAFRLMSCPPGKKGFVEMSDGVTIIDSFAFRNCSYLEGVTIPKTVRSIGFSYDYEDREKDAFENCKNLRDVSVDSQNTVYESVDGILYKNFENEEYLAFCPEGKEGSITVTDGVNYVSSGAFEGCKYLKSIELPDSIYGIGSGAFAGCSSLESMELPEPKGDDGDGYRMMIIGNGVFRGCTQLSSIYIPRSVIKIADNAFDGCERLNIICVKGSATEAYAIKNEIPYQLTEVGKQEQIITATNFTKKVGDAPFFIQASTDGDGALSYASSDESVVYMTQEGVAIIKNAGTATITVTASETERYKEAKKEIVVTVNSASSEEVQLGDTVVMMRGEYEVVSLNPLEARLNQLESEDGYLENGGDAEGYALKMPDTITVKGAVCNVVSIADNACSGLRFLNKIIVGSNVREIGRNAFWDCPNLELISAWENETYSSDDGCLYDKDFKRLICCPAGKTEVQITDRTEIIDENAFSGCTKLSSIEIPESVTSTDGEGNIFRDCSELAIHCKKGTWAHQYAVENGIHYVLTDEDGEMEKQEQIITASDFTKTVGDRAFLIGAVTSGDGILTYQVDNASVVSVSEDGIVVIEGAGMAKITITASETERYRAASKEITVTVNPASGSEVTPPSPGKKTYTITFHANGGKILSEASRKREEGKEIGTLPMAERSGYDLTGWFTLPAGGTAVTQNTKVTSDITVYAQWKKKEQPGTGGTAQKPGGSNDSDGNLNEADQIRKAKSVKAKIKSAKNVKTRSVKLKLSGLSDCDGYQIQYGLKKNFKGAKSMKKKGGSITLKKLKMKKTYYVRARTYKRIDGTLYYGKWSGKKSIKIKK